SFNTSDVSGSVGIARLGFGNSFSGHGTINVTGAINVTGMGGADVQLDATKITLGGAVNITATPGKVKESGSSTGNCGPLDITYTGSTSKAGSANLFINDISGATLAGAVTVKGPEARVFIQSGGGITASGITVTASGEKLKLKATGTDSSGKAVNFSSSQSAGSALLALQAGSVSHAQTVNVTGGIAVTGIGRAFVDIQGNTITTKSISVTQTAGKYSRIGQKPYGLFSSSSSSGPGSGGQSFGGIGGHGLLGIQQGTLTGGVGGVRLQGVTGGSSCSCQVPANAITVGGDISVSAVGDGEITVTGQTISITGGITGTAKRATIDGSGSQHSSSGGSHYNFAHTVSGSGGRMHVDIRGTNGAGSSNNGDNNYTGTVTIGGKIDLTGPTAGVEIKSGNITTHAISVNGTGEDLSVTDVYTPSGSGASFTNARAGIIEWTGIDLEGKRVTGKVTTGNLLAEGPLFAAIHIGAGTVTVGDLGIIASSGSATLLDTRISTTTVTLKKVGDAGLAISDISGTGAAPVFAPATVNGNINLEATRDVHLLSDITVSGYTLVTAGRNIDDPLPADIQRFVNDDRHGSGSGSSSGDVSTLNLNTAGLALLAGGDIILNDAILKVGTGTVDGVVGDSIGIALLATQGLASTGMLPNATFVAGGTLGIGKFTLTGDYLYMEATDYNLTGPISVPTETVVQFAPVVPTGTIDVEPGTPTAGKLNLSGDLLNLFPGTTLMVGVTGATGDVTIGSKGTITLKGGSNFLINTEGNVTGLENILTTGLVGNLLELVNFQIPTANEIQNSGSTTDDTSDEKKKKDVDTGGG
ncbi:MAG: beta strand repeat-containing protein, partial [Gammaproteobacteria bacterium]